MGKAKGGKQKASTFFRLVTAVARVRVGGGDESRERVGGDRACLGPERVALDASLGGGFSPARGRESATWPTHPRVPCLRSPRAHKQPGRPSN